MQPDCLSRGSAPTWQNQGPPKASATDLQKSGWQGRVTQEMHARGFKPKVLERGLGQEKVPRPAGRAASTFTGASAGPALSLKHPHTAARPEAPWLVQRPLPSRRELRPHCTGHATLTSVQTHWPAALPQAQQPGSPRVTDPTQTGTPTLSVSLNCGPCLGIGSSCHQTPRNKHGGDYKGLGPTHWTQLTGVTP